MYVPGSLYRLTDGYPSFDEAMEIANEVWMSPAVASGGSGTQADPWPVTVPRTFTAPTRVVVMAGDCHPRNKFAGVTAGSGCTRIAVVMHNRIDPAQGPTTFRLGWRPDGPWSVYSGSIYRAEVTALMAAIVAHYGISLASAHQIAGAATTVPLFNGCSRNWTALARTVRWPARSSNLRIRRQQSNIVAHTGADATLTAALALLAGTGRSFVARDAADSKAWVYVDWTGRSGVPGDAANDITVRFVEPYLTTPLRSSNTAMHGGILTANGACGWAGWWGGLFGDAGGIGTGATDPLGARLTKTIEFTQPPAGAVGTVDVDAVYDSGGGDTVTLLVQSSGSASFLALRPHALGGGADLGPLGTAAILPATGAALRIVDGYLDSDHDFRDMDGAAIPSSEYYGGSTATACHAGSIFEHYRGVLGLSQGAFGSDSGMIANRAVELTAAAYAAASKIQDVLWHRGTIQSSRLRNTLAQACVVILGLLDGIGGDDVLMQDCRMIVTQAALSGQTAAVKVQPASLTRITGIDQCDIILGALDANVGTAVVTPVDVGGRADHIYELRNPALIALPEVTNRLDIIRANAATNVIRGPGSALAAVAASGGILGTATPQGRHDMLVRSGNTSTTSTNALRLVNPSDTSDTVGQRATPAEYRTVYGVGNGSGTHILWAGEPNYAASTLGYTLAALLADPYTAANAANLALFTPLQVSPKRAALGPGIGLRRYRADNRIGAQGAGRLMDPYLWVGDAGDPATVTSPRSLNVRVEWDRTNAPLVDVRVVAAGAAAPTPEDAATATFDGAALLGSLTTTAGSKDVYVRGRRPAALAAEDAAGEWELAASGLGVAEPVAGLAASPTVVLTWTTPVAAGTTIELIIGAADSSLPAADAEPDVTVAASAGTVSLAGLTDGLYRIWGRVVTASLTAPWELVTLLRVTTSEAADVIRLAIDQIESSLAIAADGEVIA